MTISSTPSEISYAGDGVTVAFPIPFVFDTAADLKVLSTDADGNISTLTTGFSVSGGSGSTGTLTFGTAPASTVDITILDNPEVKQATDYVSNDPFPAESHERALDRLTRICKRLTRQFARTLHTQDGDPISDLTLGSVDNRKGKYLFFNTITGAIEYAVGIVTTALSQSIIAQLLNPQTAAEAAAGVVPTNYWVASHDSDGVVRPTRYGFNAAATAAANVIALQAAADVVEAAQTLKTYAGDGYGANTYTAPELHTPAGAFSINVDIALPTSIVVRGDKTILVQTVSTEDHFSCASPYRIDIEGIAFKGGRHALMGDGGPSLNTARVRMARCEFHTANSTEFAVLIDSGTMNMVFEDCLVLDSPLWLDVYGDYCLIDNCWVNGYRQTTGLKPNNTCSVRNRTRNMHVRGGSWVPQAVPDTSTGTRWFNNGENTTSMLVLEDVQFGAEGGGGIPIVYEYGNAAGAEYQVYPYVAISGVIARGGQLAQGNAARSDRGVVVLQGAVPGIIDIRDGAYVADGKIVSDAGFVSPTLSEWLNTNASSSSNLYPQFSINIEDIGEIGASLVPDALLPFTRYTRKARANHPGFNNLGPLNHVVTEYFPDWPGRQARILGNVSGQKRNPASDTYFDALTVTKEANESNGTGAAVIEVTVLAQGEVSGPVGFAASAKLLISLLANRGGNIQSVITVATEHNRDSGGGTSVGNIVGCQVVGTSPTTVTIRLKIGTTITSGTGTVTWSARIVSNTSTAGSPGRAFTMVSA